MELFRGVKDVGTRLIRRHDRPPTDSERQRQLTDLNGLAAPNHDPNSSGRSTSSRQETRHGISISRVSTSETNRESFTSTRAPRVMSKTSIIERTPSSNSTSAPSRISTISSATPTISTAGTSETTATSASTATTAPEAEGTTPPATRAKPPAPVIKTELVYEMEKGLFIAPHIMIDQVHYDRFREICSRLDDTLRYTFQPKGESDAALSYEFMMAGPSASLFKPAVLLICCNESHKKQLKAILKRQKWILDYSYFWQVVVDPVQKLSGWATPASGQNSFDVYTPSTQTQSSRTLCGVPAEARLDHGGKFKVAFTVGGTIMIDGESWALTAGHSFRGSFTERERGVVEKLDWEADDDSDSLYDDTTDSESPFSFSDSLGEVRAVEASRVVTSAELLLLRDSVKTHANRGAPMAGPPVPLRIGALWLPPADKSALDWGLIKLNRSWQQMPNHVQIPGGRHPLSINTTIAKNEMLQGAVWIVGGVSGTVKGWVYQFPAALRFDGNSFEAWQIKLEKPLSKGDSGAWVVQNDALCGHIVAGREGVPWAYMIRIDKIFDDIKSWTKSSNVTLPSQGSENITSKNPFRRREGLTTPSSSSNRDLPLEEGPSVRLMANSFASPAVLVQPPPQVKPPSEDDALGFNFEAPSLDDDGDDSLTLPDSRRLSGHGLDKRPQSPPSNHDGDSDSDKDHGGDAFLPLTAVPRAFTFSDKVVPEPPMTYVKEPLKSETFAEQELAEYLHSLDEEAVGKGTITALTDVWAKRSEINKDNVLKNFEPANSDSPYLHATYEVYEVGKNGLATPMNERHGDEDGEPVLDTSTVWDTISKVNIDRNAVGRMTILQEPSPLTLGAAHMTMTEHFDMDELFQHLVTKDINKGKTRAYMDRAFESTFLRQRSFFFVFKYYTILGADLIPMPWQAYDRRPLNRRSDDHIDIVECSSVLALSLQGDNYTTITQRKKQRGKIVAQKGRVYDTFAPWHLLNIQGFPDQLHSVRDEDLTEPFYNGPYAFLDCLGMEYRDAVKRYTQLYENISKLITPPDQFMFDSKLRDKLLFEDAHFTYSRRYFWAYNTLGVINDGIKSMCKSYTDTFTKEFWAGKHRTLWPHPDPDSAEGLEYAGRMAALRQELDSAVAVLREVQEKNERTRKEIGSLREQLFSGSSVKESRRAIEQGDNIKVLTGISMIFLPLTFVTGVFSITSVDIETWDWRFYTTMVAVCVPFFFLIFVLQTRVGMDALKRYWQSLKQHQVRPLMALFGGSSTTTNRAGGTGAGSGPGGTDAGGGGGVDGRGKMRRRRKAGIRRTQSGLGTNGHHHLHHINRRGTGNSTTIASSRAAASSYWAKMRAILPAWDGVISQRRKEREWEWWWQRRRRAEEGASDDKMSNT